MARAREFTTIGSKLSRHPFFAILPSITDLKRLREHQTDFLMRQQQLAISPNPSAAERQMLNLVLDWIQLQELR